MRKSILLLGIIVILFGCEKAEVFNYIVVYVTGTVQVGNYDFNNNTWGDAIDGESVEMSLIKAGGERVDETGTTGGNVGETTMYAVFNLYKEQLIEFKAKLVSNPAIIGSSKVGWDYVEKNAKYGPQNEPRTYDIDLFVALQIPIE